MNNEQEKQVSYVKKVNGVAPDTEYPSLFASTTVAVVAPLTAPTQVAVIDPIPAAPALWQSEKTLPAAMFPIVDCIPAATEPAATPLGEQVNKSEQ